MSDPGPLALKVKGSSKLGNVLTDKTKVSRAGDTLRPASAEVQAATLQAHSCFAVCLLHPDSPRPGRDGHGPYRLALPSPVQGVCSFPVKQILTELL